jgi:hypothetical protein
MFSAPDPEQQQVSTNVDHRLGSRTTAEQALRGASLSGKRAIVWSSPDTVDSQPMQLDC